MKKTIVLLFIFAAFAGSAFKKNNLHVDVYPVDINKSKLEWFAEKSTGKHNGTIRFSGGEIKSNHGNLTANFEIDMTSIEDRDIEDATMRAKLDRHLKSVDFFDVEKFPKSTFMLTSIIPLSDPVQGGPTHTVKGNLTIKDKTNEIIFGAAVSIQPDKITCSGTAVIDRSKFDVKYGSKSFFPDLGDKFIYDEFTMKFDVTAVHQ